MGNIKRNFIKDENLHHRSNVAGFLNSRSRHQETRL